MVYELSNQIDIVISHLIVDLPSTAEPPPWVFSNRVATDSNLWIKASNSLLADILSILEAVVGMKLVSDSEKDEITRI